MSNGADAINEQKLPRLCIVLPCYNEQEVLPGTIDALVEKLTCLVDDGLVASASQALFIDDGSKDATWELIVAAAEANERVAGAKLAHNRGHQNALLAGYELAAKSFDVAISMDADLQDDIDAIDEMILRYAQGANIVYGVRSDRKSDTGFKRGSARVFYKLMHWLGAETIDNHADFRLLDRVALDALAEYGEANLFLRGIVTDIGLECATVEYVRGKREHGESKYPLRKMFSLAIQGVTSFSSKPLHLIGMAGAIAVAIAIAVIVYSLVMWAIGNTISGWTTTVCSIWFIGGVQLICLSVIGEYVGKVYSETKRRPRYLIEKTTWK